MIRLLGFLKLNVSSELFFRRTMLSAHSIFEIWLSFLVCPFLFVCKYRLKKKKKKTVKIRA